MLRPPFLFLLVASIALWLRSSRAQINIAEQLRTSGVLVRFSAESISAVFRYGGLLVISAGFLYLPD